MSRSKKIILFTLGLLLILALVSFMKVSPMTSSEVDTYIEKITQLSHVPGGQHDLKKLKHFFNTDDGEPFYTVNLYKYHERAQYLSDNSSSISGVQAYEKFSTVMVKLLFQNYSYPIFGSNWLDLSTKGWDRIVIVKYRSRRDMAKIFADPKFSIASEDKWASIEKHDRFVVKALHLPEVYMLLIFCFCVVLSIFFIRRKTTFIEPRL
jgi:hypothetical protein